jgi:cardiolipin synthase
VHAWFQTFLVAAIVVAAAASGHAVLYNRDSRGAMLWVGLIWCIPLAGAAFYFGFGINRIKRRAVLLRRDRARYRSAPVAPTAAAALSASYLAPLDRALCKITSRALVPGNQIDPLADGDAAYPAMLAAIAGARDSIALSTYLFEPDAVGREFAKALGDAVGRGVEVRVLIDATGTFFSWPPILGALRHGHVTYARFLPAFSLMHPVSLNLRTHRKLLIVDGCIGFTGGMNILEGHGWRKRNASMHDLHFRVRGPVVAHLQEAFADDWFFTTGEALRGEKWFRPLAAAGPTLARGIADGPDEDFEQVRWTFLTALSVARRSVRVLTPYFLPDTAIISALNVAAMRGVAVHIVLPSDGDVPFVQWASEACWWQLLEHGCRIWVAPPPFDHSKLFIIDETWVLLGSSNWDPRSLRLNFEFNLECHDAAFGENTARHFDERRRAAREVTLAEVNGRGLATRLRDGIVRLATPFL